MGDGWNSRYFLVLHGVDVEAWAKKHEITPYTGPCTHCGQTRTTSIPFAQGQFRGLMAPACPCGEREGVPYCLVRDAKYGDLLSGGAPKQPSKPKKRRR